LAHNWWYQDSCRHKQSTCFYNRLRSRNFLHSVVCMRHHLYLIKRVQLKYFLFPNKNDTTYLSNNWTILWNVHILCWWWGWNSLPSLYDCSSIDRWLVFRLVFDSWWNKLQGYYLGKNLVRSYSITWCWNKRCRDALV
jgi:hypothetical protein